MDREPRKNKQGGADGSGNALASVVRNPNQTWRTKMNLQQEANRIARQAGHSIADHIVIGDAIRVVKHIAYGYRKYTTGEYASNKYRACFGWKNTYYQNASTTVMLRDPRAGFSGTTSNFVSAT